MNIPCKVMKQKGSLLVTLSAIGEIPPKPPPPPPRLIKESEDKPTDRPATPSPDIMTNRKMNIPCKVMKQKGAWLVTFENNKKILLQNDYDQALFAVDSGYSKAPVDWDGTPSGLGAEFYDLDCEIIEHCPDNYLSLSE